ncbi:hypothetical protein TTHERM_000423264 (macronuclear) [Tetrahymena thermophila SB210]|uniref:Uncharacterized protein n=1 Tax=Tetrahymena thermophila (strain SB210) TaxID=312017 RepID=W7X6E2_TETTS|nr:hypothetical protein TTHERM_000423264 [Tetrahymena thermophila SB210]EWS74950.1 hypothetical protein TTHERM_000423264 [Tetrahymena thermophila SB210]|eukprot:XP_012652491.1 hypothetical protein TTHERM_000423264 [Tetrahymena thermophila SB210]
MYMLYLKALIFINQNNNKLQPKNIKSIKNKKNEQINYLISSYLNFDFGSRIVRTMPSWNKFRSQVSYVLQANMCFDQMLYWFMLSYFWQFLQCLQGRKSYFFY